MRPSPRSRDVWTSGGASELASFEEENRMFSYSGVMKIRLYEARKTVFVPGM